jgi:hypothetical protein
MPRYFFNLYDDCVLIDEEGAELPTVDAAWQRALHVAREMACQEVLEGKLTLSHRIEVEDEDRKPIVVIPFGDAVTVEK